MQSRQNPAGATVLPPIARGAGVSASGTGDGSAPGTARWRRYRSGVVVVLVGLVLTGALAAVVNLVNGANDQRLLNLQVAQAAATLAASLPGTQAKLEADYQVAVNTEVNATIFKKFAAAQIASPGGFASVSVWQLGAKPKELAVVGAAPELNTLPGGPAAVFASAHPSKSLTVVSLLSAAVPRLGFVEVPPGPTSNLAIYASVPIAPDKRLFVPKGSAFSDVKFALYLGRSKTAANLIESSGPLPITGRQSSDLVPFGNSSITLIGTPVHDLSGYLSENLYWMVVIAGVLISLVAALGTQGLVRSTERAEGLAQENRRLYSQQMAVAVTLQHALLPTRLPDLAGLEMAVRYLPGVAGLEIGGDWYDVMPIDEDHCAMVVGDVSGRGLAAATTMAGLRYAIRAYVAQGDPPEVVLDKLGDLLSIERDGQFATVLCGIVDVPGHRVTLANAGHPPALLISDGGAVFVDMPVGPPVGAPRRAPRQSVEVAVPPGATMLVVTDGLVERRGESIDDGLERLRACAAAPDESLEATLSRMLEILVPQGSPDDIAVLGIRWHQ